MTGADYSYQSDEGYTYDSNGNRTNSGYVTGSNNQLLEDSKYLYAYDAVGRRTMRIDKVTSEVAEYQWDIRDRLTGVVIKDVSGAVIRSATYVYDVYDQRIAKVVDADGDGVLAPTTERFVYGSNQNIALAFDGDGNLTHRYLYGDGVDQIEADQQVATGNTLWALADHEGSVRDVVDSSGSVLNHVVYDAFGNVSSQSNASVVFRFGYTARELDAESGLQYNRARYFDPAVGRFISEDPIGFEAGDTNLNRYVFNSPTNYTDPSGKIAFLAPLIYFGGAALAGLLIGGGLNAARQVAQMKDDPCKKFDLDEVKLSAGIGSIFGVVGAIFPGAIPYFSAFGTGYGLGTGAMEISQGNYATGAFDIATSIAGGALTLKSAQAKEITNLSFRLTKNKEIREGVPQAKYGHFGFSFDQGKTIFGFGPIETATEAGLKARNIYPGKLTNDTNIFNKASDLGLKITQSEDSIVASKFYSARIKAGIDEFIGTLAGKRYQLPPKQGGSPQGCYNCVTYPASIGLPASSKGNLP